jgi:hypothetical protein
MALSATSTIDKAKTVWRVDAGLSMALLDLTTSTGSSGADYSAGFDLSAIAAQLGFRHIFAVLYASVWNKPTLRGIWAIPASGAGAKLRFYLPAGTEVTTDIAAGDKIRCLIAGI